VKRPLTSACLQQEECQAEDRLITDHPIRRAGSGITLQATQQQAPSTTSPCQYELHPMSWLHPMSLCLAIAIGHNNLVCAAFHTVYWRTALGFSAMALLLKGNISERLDLLLTDLLLFFRELI